MKHGKFWLLFGSMIALGATFGLILYNGVSGDALTGVILVPVFFYLFTQAMYNYFDFF